DSAFFVDFVHQDITEGLKYNEKYFDIVLCNFVLMFMEHKHLENTINDILRVTKGFCIIETQKQFYKSKKSSMVDYDFKEIVKIIEGNNEFEILDKKIYKEKLIIRRKYNG
ncbi:MAG: class I SAM-dependent methyltransferase, partial [Clostridium sp.]